MTSGADHALTGASGVSTQFEVPNGRAASPTDSGPQLPGVTPAAVADDRPGAPDAAALTAAFLSSVGGRVSPASAFIPDQWPAVELLDQQSAWDAARGLRWRVRVVVGDFKYPTLRLEEALRPDPSGEERLIAQEAMVADHVLATARAEVGEADLSQLLRASGVTVRRRQPGSDVYLLEIPGGRSVAGLPAALTALSGRDAPLYVVEPDYLAR